MPRANRYFVPGLIYHLTHRCHNRQFLFRFARDRNAYRHALWQSSRAAPVSVFAYCVTSNHTHLLARAESTTALSQWMQQLEGQFAQSYNRRKGRSGAFWADRYHCTMIEPGGHLWRCMIYIDLNMARAGQVKHPSQWPWCGYNEWAGARRRYRVLDQAECLRALGGITLEDFRIRYEDLIQETLARDMVREPHWTETIAVGSRTFVESVAQTVKHRQELLYSTLGESSWVLREGTCREEDGVA